MAQTCGCHATRSAPVRDVRGYRADQTVEEVGKDPAALAVLKAMGVNHCCGAHLTLNEAAAAAGIAVHALLDRLNETADAPA